MRLADLGLAKHFIPGEVVTDRVGGVSLQASTFHALWFAILIPCLDVAIQRTRGHDEKGTR